MQQRFAVIGNPIAHSLSPRIHQLFAQAAGIALEYRHLLAPPDDFEGTISRFFAAGGAGVNVTLPFKEAAFAWVDDADRAAVRAGAVNTVALIAGRHVGFNTDGPGLLRDLCATHGVAIEGRRILVIGAGGGVRGVLGPLLDAGAAEIVVANRTPARAQSVVEVFADRRLRAVALDAVSASFDVIVNGTSASLSGDVPDVDPAIVANGFCYDMAYAAAPTPFLAWAQQNGAAAIVDGLGMLIEQAALAFQIWHAVLPDTRAVTTRIRAELTAR
jgi:shikimate dehydrogenase